MCEIGFSIKIIYNTRLQLAFEVNEDKTDISENVLMKQAHPSNRYGVEVNNSLRAIIKYNCRDMLRVASK